MKHRAVCCALCIAVVACASARNAERSSTALATTAAYMAADNREGFAPVAGDLARMIAGIAAEQDHPLQQDRRLARLASLVAATSGGATAREVEFMARQLGLYDPGFVVLTQPAPEPVSTSPLSAALTRSLGGQPFTHYGAVWHEEQGQRGATIVLSTRRVQFEPLASAVPLGVPLHLRAHLAPGWKSARVESLSEAKRIVVPLGDTRELSVQLPADRAGLHRIAVIAEGAHGDEILAKLPVYVGAPFPRRIEPLREPQYDLAGVSQRIFASINRERAAAGLPQLRRDPRLDALAAQHGADMREHEFIGHTSARSGDPTQRVARAGLPTALVLETIARAGSPAALEASSAAPAGELRNLLSRSVTHAGIGVTVEYDAQGPLWVATELFVDLPEPVDLATAMPELLSLVNEARVKRGAGTVALDAGLRSLALQAAEHFVHDAHATEQTILAETDHELGRFSLAYRRVHALLVVAQHLQDAASLEPALDPDASGVGIGIARGERDGNAVLAVVMLVGTRR